MRKPSSHFVGPLRTRPRRRRTRPLNKRFATRPPLPRSSARPRAMVPRDTQGQMFNRAESLKNVQPFYEITSDAAKSDSSSNSVCEVIEVLVFDEQTSGQGGNDGGSNPTSNPFDDQDDPLDVCNSCGHCVDCLVQRESLKNGEDCDRESHVTVRNFSAFGKSIGQDDQNGRYTMTKTKTATSETLSITNLDEGPILVDLTSDETNVKSERTLLTKPCDIEDVTGTYGEDDTEDWDNISESKSRETLTMIADSSNRLHRGNAGSSSMATALRDRGPCVIPMQPNPSLPIRPAPAVPMRSTVAKPRKGYTPPLKVSNELSVHVVEVDPSKPMSTCSGSAPNDENGFNYSDQMSRDDCKIASIDSFLSSEASNGAGSATLKRKVSEGREKEAERDAGNKDSRKRRKSHDTDSSQGREEHDDAFKDFPKNSPGNAIDKGNRNMQRTVDPWIEKRYPTSVSVPTSPDHCGKEKRNYNKVPPLRLKKVVREGSSDDYRSAEMATGLENEPNYRIVTGATPRPDALPTSMSNTSSWARVMLGNDRDLDIASVNQPECEGVSRHSSPMTDGCKLKYRRNRLRQKLQELRGKALDLGQQMANSSGDTSPQQVTRLSQMMNCYEKQIENLSKLLNTLSTASPSDDVVQLEEDNVRDCCEMASNAAADDYGNVSILHCRSPSLSSPEPPKLSPRSPVDYNENKSSCEVRDSPPVLPRAPSILPPILEPNTDRNSQNRRNSWSEDVNKGKVVLSPSMEAQTTESRHSAISNSNNAISERRRSTPSVPRSASVDREGEREVVDVDTGKACLPDVKNPATLNSSRRTSENGDNTVIGHMFKEKRENKEQIASDNTSCSTVPVPVKNGSMAEVDARSQFKHVGGPMMGSVTGGVAVPKPVRCGDPVYTTIVPTATRIQAPSAMNVLQLQPNYYPSIMPTNNILPGGITENSRPTHKVTSSSNHCGSMECTPAPLPFNQIGSSTGLTDNQRSLLPNDAEETVQANTSQRNDSTRIMAEQFPTLGNWVARMSKKHVSKSKSKLQATVVASHTSENNIRVSYTQLHSSLLTTPVPVSEGQKVNTSSANSVPRSNIVNVAPQWNSQRWQQMQHQHERQQQQLLQQVAAAAAPSANLQVPPPSRPGFCPPLSVAQFYPNNYPIDPYGGTAFGYHSALYPYAGYPFHPRLHSGTPLDGYQIPIQDQLNSQLRSLSHADKRLSSLQDPSRHFATDILKYSGPLPAGPFQHPNTLDYDRLRTTTAAQGTGLTSLLLPPPRPPLQSTAPASLPRTSLNGYSNGNNQYGRRMIPDVVAAAAAAAVVAAASFRRRRDPLPPYSRSEADNAASAAVPDIVANEAPRLSSGNRLNNSNREHAAAAEQTPLMNSGSLNGSNEELRLSAASYNPLQNLLMDGVPFMRNKTNYGQAPVFPNNARVSTPSTIVPPSSSRIHMGKTDAVRDDSARYCETPHLGKVNRSPDTVSNIMCSNCGLPGSMFKCLGCEAAFYCDERCQARHWTVHGEKCPKKMPKLKKVA